MFLTYPPRPTDAVRATGGLVVHDVPASAPRTGRPLSRQGRRIGDGEGNVILASSFWAAFGRQRASWGLWQGRRDHLGGESPGERSVRLGIGGPPAGTGRCCSGRS